MPNKRFKLAAVAGAFAVAFPGDVRAAVRLIPPAHFSGVSFDLRSPNLDLTTLSKTGFREFLHMIRSQGLELASLNASIGPAGLGKQADVDQVIQQLRTAMITAAALGAPPVCVDLGRLPVPPVADTPAPRITPEQAGRIILPAPADIVSIAAPPAPSPQDDVIRAQIDGALFALAAHADRYGIRLAFRSRLSSFAALTHTVARSSCLWFGYDLDTVSQLQDRWSLGEVLNRVAGRLFHVVARDAVTGEDNRTTDAPIGKGEVNWPAVLDGLEESAYRGWITIDPDNLPNRTAASVNGAAWLHTVDADARSRNNPR